MERELWQKNAIGFSSDMWYTNENDIEISQVVEIFLVYLNFWNNMQVIIF